VALAPAKAARPPRAVSLYTSFMSAPVSRKRRKPFVAVLAEARLEVARSPWRYLKAGLSRRRSASRA